MKKLALYLLLFGINVCYSYCQPSVSVYDFVALVNGSMKKELICDKHDYSLKSHILAEVLFYKVTYDETATGKKDEKTGVRSLQYVVNDSRKSDVMVWPVEKDEVDIQSVPLVFGYALAKKLPLPKQLKVIAEDGVAIYDFRVISSNENIKTPIGELETVKIFSEEKSGTQITYWFWKKNYTMVKEDILDDGQSIFEATISNQSGDSGCCWS